MIMDWGSLLKENFNTIFTALAVLGASFLTFLGSIVREYFSSKSELRHRKAAWQKEYREKNIIEPIMDFFDRDLRSFSKITSEVNISDFESRLIMDRGITNRSRARIESATKSLIDRGYELGLIETKVQSLEDKALSKIFEDYKFLRSEILKMLTPDIFENPDELYQQIREARALAGIIEGNLEGNVIR